MELIILIVYYLQAFYCVSCDDERTGIIRIIGLTLSVYAQDATANTRIVKGTPAPKSWKRPMTYIHLLLEQIRKYASDHPYWQYLHVRNLTLIIHNSITFILNTS